jgi:outer membrane protein assembly factor BamB
MSISPRSAAAALLLALAACQPSDKVVVIHPDHGEGARDVFSVDLMRQITVPDVFVLRPDEFAAVTVDHARDLLYIGSREGTLLALDHDSGAIRWELPFDAAVSSKPAIVDLPDDDARQGKGALLLVGTDNGALHAIDLDTRETLWTYETNGKIRQPPTVFDRTVYFVNSRDQVFALDLASGQWRWQYEQEFQTDFTVNGKAGIVFVPAVDDTIDESGVVYTGFDGGRVVALGGDSGEALWLQSVAPPEGGNFIDCDTTPLVDEERREIIVAGMATGIYGLSMDDGSVRWTFPLRGVGGLSWGPGGEVIGTSSLQGVFALERGGAPLWRTMVDPGVLSTPVVVLDTVFATHSESGLLAFDIPTGRFLAQINPGSGMSSVPVYDPVNERFYATTNRGLLLALRIQRSFDQRRPAAPAATLR